MSALNTIEYEKDTFLLSELLWKEWEKRVSELREGCKDSYHKYLES